MANSLGSSNDRTSLDADSKAFLWGVGTVALLSATGVLPRLGRVMKLGWRSYFQTTYPLSVRKSDIQELNQSLLFMGRGSYAVVIGGKGIGKSCLIDTALNRRHGVVKISTQPEADKDVIVVKALRAITSVQIPFLQPEETARRVLFFYSFLFKCPPIVVIRVAERQFGERRGGHLTAAVRDLAEVYGLTVIVDGCPNSLPPNLLATKREIVIAVEPMSREEIESIPELQDLIDFLRRSSLDEPVWSVLGGSPADYLALKGAVDKRKSISHAGSPDKVVNYVKDHLHMMLSDALNNHISQSNSTTKQIIEIFRRRQITKISLSELAGLDLLSDYSDKVFHEVIMEFDYFLAPSSPALSLIISENVKDDDDVYELREKLCKLASKDIK